MSRENKELLVEMGYEDAVEFIDYNTIRALPYFTNSPIIMYPLQ